MFSTFQPAGVEPTDEDLCRETGSSRIYGLLATSGDGILVVSGSRSRYLTVDDFVTAPFTEQAQTKNPPPETGGEGDGTADQLDDALRQILRDLQALFPRSCRFNEGYRIDIKARSSDTGMLFIAPVPICVIERDFREH